MSITEFISHPLVTATQAEPVSVVVRRMVETGVGAVVVVEDDRLVGLFSERDLLVRVVGKGLDPTSTLIADVMTCDVVTVAPSDSLKEGATRLRSNRIRHLPVVENGQPVGIVSARDFFESVAGQFERLLGQRRYDEQLAEDKDPYDHIGGSYGR